MKIFKYLLVISWLASSVIAKGYDCYISADFSNGSIPDGFSLYDIDGLEQSPDNAVYGFGSHDSWIVGRFFDDSDYSICATSYFITPGKASNWIVTDPFLVDSENAQLIWNARSANSKLPDGYSVYISTQGNSPESFIGEPVFHVDKEESNWIRHKVELGKFKGKQISVAFVHDSYDSDRLCINEIFAGVPASAYLLCDLPSVVGTPDALDVCVSVYTRNENPIEGFSVELASRGKTYRKDFPDVVLNPGEYYPVVFEGALWPIENESLDYTLRVSVSGDSYEHTSSLSYLPVRVMCEELTGTWCGYCVCGIVELDNMKRDYPDTFICSAVHINDVMSCREWSARVSGFIGSGLPTMVMNHDLSATGHPRKIRDYYKSLVKNKPVASIYVDSSYDPETRMVNGSTYLKFSEDVPENRYRVEYGVIENDVYHPGSAAYSQHNAYAGGGSGEMEGWENMPSVVDGVHFNDVARMYIGDCGALPSVVAMEEITHSVEFRLDDKVENPENAELLSFLIDGENRVVNVGKTPLKGEDCGIHLLEESRIIISEGVIKGGKDLRLYSVDGRLISASEEGRITLPEMHGILILVVDGVSRKIML